MVLRLTERLDVPLRERNGLLVAAGFAPVYREWSIDWASTTTKAAPGPAGTATSPS